MRDSTRSEHAGSPPVEQHRHPRPASRRSARSADQVDVTYLRGGHPFTARARGVVLAGYNMMIPYLCPELPAAQKEALHELVKTPLVYTSVALRNWRAFHKLGIPACTRRADITPIFSLNPHVNIGVTAVRQAGGSDARAHGAHSLQSRVCPNMIRIGRPGGTTRHHVRDLRAQHPRSAWRARWVPEDSIPLATLTPSPSIAGRTAMRRNTIRCSIRSCRRSSERMSSVGCTLGVLPLPIPIPAAPLIRIRP